MNPLIDLNQMTLQVHIFLAAFIILLFIVFGYLIGRAQLAKNKKRILELENEMLHNHNEILESAKHNKQLREMLEKAKIPVPLMPAAKTEEGEEVDEKVRKIPLGKIG
jgi:hypothetical protein